MSFRLAALLVGLGIAGVLPRQAFAQRYRVTMPSGPQQLDSTQQRYHDLLMGVRDTLQTVSTAAQDLQRDLGESGAITVSAHAARLTERCGVARTALARMLPELAPARAPRAARAKALDMSHTIEALDATLAHDCVDGLGRSGAGFTADSLRAWAPYRISRIDRAIVSYDHAAFEFAHAAGFRLDDRLRR
jgi:hypothetical protein